MTGPRSIDSTAASTANLAKNIVGAGVLSLPSGAGKVLDAASGSAVGSHDANVSALLLLYVIFGALNAYGFYLIGEVCERTGARTYQEAREVSFRSVFCSCALIRIAHPQTEECFSASARSHLNLSFCLSSTACGLGGLDQNAWQPICLDAKCGIRHLQLHRDGGLRRGHWRYRHAVADVHGSGLPAQGYADGSHLLPRPVSFVLVPWPTRTHYLVIGAPMSSMCLVSHSLQLP